ncbi:CPBP family intramembrane glutamic endopeptidase [Haloarcula sebkhae]|uniref:Lysostaphin resistance A-like protein n=2 Tax=Haloarcula sebkhae TaxID=932660 RepID=A0ACC6VIV0_9EURY|nr:type II CAAX endopeptidase family protein [Haloarcula sebkhae]GGK59821.1 CPBP family intramembrane metalloprotease [Haloarcula sebkhae]
MENAEVMRNDFPDNSKWQIAGISLGLTVASVLAALAIESIVRIVVVELHISASALLQVFLNKQAQAGFLVVALGYLAIRPASSRFVQIRVPSVGDVGWLLGLLALIPVTSAAKGDWWLTESLQTTPLLWAVVFVVWFLVAAPVEELLFRGIIQTQLTEQFRAPVGILVAAGLFGLMHFLFAITHNGGTPLSTGLVTFAMGGVFGTVYHRTNNLVILSLGHALYWISPAVLYYV